MSEQESRNWSEVSGTTRRRADRWETITRHPERMRRTEISAAEGEETHRASWNGVSNWSRLLEVVVHQINGVFFL